MTERELKFSIFRDKVLSGEKTQTVRGMNKMQVGSGDTLNLIWVESSREPELIGTTVCTLVDAIAVDYQGIRVMSQAYKVFDEEAAQAFAQADGFGSTKEFVGFIEANYGLPFRGVVIHWEPLRTEETVANDAD